MNLLCFFLLVFFNTPQTETPSKPLATLVPPNSVFYFELRSGKELGKRLRDHGLIQAFQKSPLISTLESKPEYKKLQAVLKAFEIAAQKPAAEALEILSDQGAALSLRPGKRPGTPTYLLLLRSSDTALSKRIFETASPLIVAGNSKAQLQHDDEDDNPWLEIPDKLAMGLNANLLGVSNDPQLLREAWAALKEKDRPSLASKTEFVDAQKRTAWQGPAWAYFDLAALRELLPGKNFLPSKADNPLGALWLGGTLNAFHESNYLSAGLSFDAKSLMLQILFPVATPKDSPFFFPITAEKGQFANPPDTISRYRTSRDLLKFWLDRERYVQEEDFAKLVEFQSNLGILFGGKKLDSEILPELGRDMEIFVIRQNYESLKIPPLQQFPGFAIAFRLPHPDKFATSAQLAFQTTIGVVNAQRAQQGKPGFLISSEAVNGVSVNIARYAYEKADDKPAANDQNFSPALAIVADRLLIGSSASTVKDLVRAFDPVSTPMSLGIGDREFWESETFWIDATALRKILADNESSLIANNMLTKMQDKSVATVEIHNLLNIVDLFQGLHISQRVDDGRLGYLIQLSAK